MANEKCDLINTCIMPYVKQITISIEKCSYRPDVKNCFVTVRTVAVVTVAVVIVVGVIVVVFEFAEAIVDFADFVVVVHWLSLVV